MSNYFNEAGEPLMDAAAMRYEMYLDSTYEPDPYDGYDDYEAPYVDPEDCDHSDWSQRGWSAECDSGCESSGLVLVRPDWDNTDPNVVDVIVWNI